ncbi:hypothetical protein F4813DRAFT_399072 [Daldinia decipiens]|uniref:uncharacterized protein n=1 Tax=Daldinia decipiens TaxID=326647 RepID=UPI0020C34700|nr:uncharacterized protein F4813DRAFT_399072 [Daldinia decipiens]KAI1654351.1 hypothetical protein F4813DRAFT_399072 [Daldinia decipiens]
MRPLIARGSPVLPPSRLLTFSQRLASSQSHSQYQENNQHSASTDRESVTTAKNQGKQKTMAEIDAELQRKMSGLSGDGGEAGIEYEDGKPVAMKRGVRDVSVSLHTWSFKRVYH